MLDRPVPLADLRQSLADVARLNLLFGGRRVTLRHVTRLLSELPASRPAIVLDVGAGSADIARALIRWARRARRPIRVIALDQSLPTLGIARRLAAGYKEMRLVQADALALPVRPGSVDVVISALTLHHCEPEAAARHLAEMDQAARCGVVVNDLARGRAAYGLVWLVTRVLARSPLSRHDGPLSVRRAYRPVELRALCEKAGLFDVQIVRHPLALRQCAVRRKS
jgi:SAM-dependent methyltransferase